MILFEIATSAPYEMNIDKMANRFGVSRPSVFNYLTYLEEAGLIRGVLPKGVRLVHNPEAPEALPGKYQSAPGGWKERDRFQERKKLTW